jgi:hypothetical protein
MKEYIKNIKIDVLLLALFLGRLIFVGANIAESLVVAFLVAYILGDKFLSDKREVRLSQDMFTELHDKMEKIEDQVSSNSLVQAVKPNKRSNLI